MKLIEVANSLNITMVILTSLCYAMAYSSTSEVSDSSLSSDEYSEDENNDLIQTAVAPKKTLPSRATLKQTSTIPSYLKKENKIKNYSNIYKKKSIKWLNNKKERNKYKQYILKFLEVKNLKSSNSLEIYKAAEYSNTSGSVENKKILDSGSKTGENCYNNPEAFMKKKSFVEPPDNNTSGLSTKQAKEIILHRDINQMFPKYNKIVDNHIKCENGDLNVLDESIAHITLQIDSLTELLKEKEAEWNRILHLKRVKGEILARMIREKYIMTLKEERIKDLSLSELKKLELYFSHPSDIVKNNCQSSAKNIIQEVANLTKKKLEEETDTTDRIQRILEMNDILPKNQKAFNVNSIWQVDGKEIKSMQCLSSNEYKGIPNDLLKHIDPIGKTMNERKKQTLKKKYDYENLFNNFQKEIEKQNCQECNMRKAKFVCAGCGNQWYCSRNCQVTAWDKHSEVCDQ